MDSILTFIRRRTILFVIAALVALAVTRSLVSFAPFGIALQVLAIALSVWARRSFPAGAFRVDADPAAAVVLRGGPYRVIRHPMYAAALLFIWVAILTHLSAWRLALGAILTIVVAMRITFEEGLLRRRYPEYESYARDTKAVVPFLL